MENGQGSNIPLGIRGIATCHAAGRLLSFLLSFMTSLLEGASESGVLSCTAPGIPCTVSDFPGVVIDIRRSDEFQWPHVVAFRLDPR